MRVVYISSCALQKDGATDPFMMQEHDWLLAHFDRAQMVSFYGCGDFSASDGKAMEARKPALAGLRASLAAPFSRDLWRGLSRMRRAGALGAISAMKLFAFTRRGLKMHYYIEAALKDAGDEAVTLYSCWMSFDGYAAALSKRRHRAARLVVRGHAFDIDAERNFMNTWLMKDEIAAEADGIYLISETAREQYMAYMRGRADESRIHVLAMGSGGAPLPLAPAPRLSDGVLHIVSCAKIIEIKQVPLLAEALSRWEGCPVSWTHIGGGEGEAELRALCEEKLDRKENVIWEITGQMDKHGVDGIYDARAFDLFINTSRKEGVPVSIMEAMRHGVPAIAPRVGGIPELVGGDAGILYEPQDGADGVLDALERFAAMSGDEAARMRKAAKARWEERFQSDRLLGELFPEAADRSGAQ